jgi:hypothetical protein
LRRGLGLIARLRYTCALYKRACPAASVSTWHPVPLVQAADPIRGDFAVRCELDAAANWSAQPQVLSVRRLDRIVA